METGDLAVHGHEVYPSDVPSLSYPSGCRRPGPRGGDTGAGPRAEPAELSRQARIGWREPPFAGAPRRSARLRRHERTERPSPTCPTIAPGRASSTATRSPSKGADSKCEACGHDEWVVSQNQFLLQALQPTGGARAGRGRGGGGGLLQPLRADPHARDDDPRERPRLPRGVAGGHRLRAARASRWPPARRPRCARWPPPRGASARAARVPAPRCRRATLVSASSGISATPTPAATRPCTVW